MVGIKPTLRRLILPQFPGHPDKRFNIAIRGERDEGKDQAGGQGQPEPL
jgi:hypothetical protein